MAELPLEGTASCEGLPGFACGYIRLEWPSRERKKCTIAIVGARGWAHHGAAIRHELLSIVKSKARLFEGLRNGIPKLEDLTL